MMPKCRTRIEPNP